MPIQGLAGGYTLDAGKGLYLIYMVALMLFSNPFIQLESGHNMNVLV